jgi:hypothetical protein
LQIKGQVEVDKTSIPDEADECAHPGTWGQRNTNAAMVENLLAKDKLGL